MKMKKFINNPDNLTSELLEGMVAAYPNKIKLEEGKLVVRARPKPEGKVAVLTLGGSGHEPALSGFVGLGMLDCSVVGGHLCRAKCGFPLEWPPQVQARRRNIAYSAKPCRGCDERQYGYENGGARRN